MVTGLVLMFALTAGGVIWLARDVDRAISHRTSAQSIAFQAARSGAHEVDVIELRRGAVDPVPLDAVQARRAAIDTASLLFDAYELHGAVVEVSVEVDRVTVRVEIYDAGRTVTGSGTARSTGGP